MLQDEVPFGVPNPSPTGTDVGARLVSVTVTAPAWVTVNETNAEPFIPSVPVVVSVGVVDGVDGDEPSWFKRLQPAPARATQSARAGTATPKGPLRCRALVPIIVPVYRFEACLSV